MNSAYDFLKAFMKKYPLTMAWRIKAHAKVVDEHLGADEKILYAFTGQNNESVVEIFNTYVVVFTNKRIAFAKKRMLFGYFFKSITPDMYNDLSVNKGLIWGNVTIDTVKEIIRMTNIDAKALPEIDQMINEIMINQKKEYGLELSKKNTTKK